MPQASEKLRAKMTGMFGSIDTAGPIGRLQEAGYELTNDFTWQKPGVTELWEMSQEELTCMQFLVDEWDFGGLAETNDG